MSKPKQKVEIEEEKAGKLGFENTPKLFNKWSYDELKVRPILPRLKTPASSIISLSNLPNLRSSSPTPLADIRPRGSVKLSAPSSKDLWAPCSSLAETLVRK